jgi:hypothetical protein
MQDGRQGISHDRILMRIKDYLQILTTVIGIIWMGYQGMRYLDRMNQNVTLLQQEVSALEQMVVTSRNQGR